MQLNRWRDCATRTWCLPTDALALWTKGGEECCGWITGLSLSLISPESEKWREDSWRLHWKDFFYPNPVKALWATNFYNEQLRLLDLNILGLLVNTPKSELSLKSSLQDWSNYFSLYGAQQHRVALFCTLLMHFLLFYSYTSGHEVSHLSHLLQFLLSIARIVTESVYFSQIP